MKTDSNAGDPVTEVIGKQDNATCAIISQSARSTVRDKSRVWARYVRHKSQRAVT